MPSRLSLLLLASCASVSTVFATEATLSLEDAIRQALQQNQSIQVQDLQREISDARVTVARGVFDPTLRLQRSTTHDETPLSVGALLEERVQDNYSLSLGGYTPWGLSYDIGGTATTQRGPAWTGNRRSSSNAGVSITQPVLKGFGTSTALQGLRLAKLDQKIADWEFQQTAIDIVTAVVTAYYDVVEARENLRISEGYRTNVRALASGHQRRLEIGTLAEADVANAQSRAAQIEESVLYSQQGLRNAEQRLRRLLGATSFGDVTSLTLLPVEKPVAFTPAGLSDLQRALELRPDVQAARQGVKRAEILRTVARLGLLPTLDLVASYGYGDMDPTFSGSRRGVLDREARVYSAGFVLSVPLTQAEARGNHRTARAAHRQRETELLALEADVALALDRVARAITTAEQRVESLTRAEALARRSLDAEEKRFRAGTGNTFFVLQQQGELAGVENNLIRARCDLHRAYAYYDREVGRTLERYGIILK